MLYDMTGQMATRLRTLLRCFWRRIIAPSRDMRLMADVSSSVGEDVMLWSGCMKHRAPRCKVFKNRQLLSHLRLWTTSAAGGGSRGSPDVLWIHIDGI
jgi:hypothetical protein